MDIHKPKPWHGVREFLKEFGTIVVGVLVALGAEQAVERLEWAHKADLAENLMRAEISGDDGPQVYFRIAFARCQTQELTEIRGLAEDGAARNLIVQRITLLKGIYYTWDSAAYRAADSSGVLVHLPRDRLGDISQFYELMPSLNGYSEREATSLAHLHALSAKGGAISDAERQSLLTAVEELSNDVVWIRDDTLNAADAMYRAGFSLDRGGQSVFDSTLAEFMRPEFASCLAQGLSDLRKATSKSQATRYFVSRDNELTAPAAPKK
jgi:hypothetical protein